MTVPFTTAEAALLRRAWTDLWPVAKILAELTPRNPAEVLHHLDLMLSPVAPTFDAEGQWTELDRAILALPGRVTRVRRCPLGFRLDGRPASAAQIVAAANAFLAAMGYELIRWPERAGRVECL